MTDINNEGQIVKRIIKDSVFTDFFRTRQILQLNQMIQDESVKMDNHYGIMNPMNEKR